MNEKTRHIKNLIRRNIEETDPTAAVILYGSRARGDERPDSDWDILILIPYPATVEKERMFRDHLYELEVEVGEPFSLFVYSQEEWEKQQRSTPFYETVSRDGIRL